VPQGSQLSSPAPALETAKGVSRVMTP
jgi:hypothetical protein